jgi:hypothetical protein
LFVDASKRGFFTYSQFSSAQGFRTSYSGFFGNDRNGLCGKVDEQINRPINSRRRRLVFIANKLNQLQQITFIIIVEKRIIR